MWSFTLASLVGPSSPVPCTPPPDDDDSRERWPKVPDVFIQFQDLAYSVQIPRIPQEIPNIVSVSPPYALLPVFRFRTLSWNTFNPVHGLGTWSFCNPILRIVCRVFFHISVRW